MGKADLKKQNRPVNWPKEELQRREEAMDQLNPGYYDMKLKLAVLLGLVLFVRGYYIALSGLLKVQPVSQIVVMMLGLLSLLISWAYYQVIIQGYCKWLAVILMVVRGSEVVTTIISSSGYLFYMNFIVKIWWVTSVIAIFLDAVFLAYLVFSKKVRHHMALNRIIHSGEEIAVPEETICMDSFRTEADPANGEMR